MKRRSQAGQTLVLAAFGLTVFMLAAGLAIDMGYLRYQKRRMQAAADSAAIAGASELASGTWSAAAATDAAANGFTANSSTLVTPTTPPCPDGTVNNCVQVVIQQQQPLFFMHIVPNIPNPTITAQAVAELQNGLGCMYALGNAVGIVAGGPAAHELDLEAENCNVLSNGPVNFNNDIIDTVNARAIGYVGTQLSTPNVQPTPRPIPAVSDQLQSTLSNYMNVAGSTGSCSAGAGGITCIPGDYPSGITITSVNPNQVTVQTSAGIVTANSPNLTVTFNPGFYSLGGNLTVIGNTANSTEQVINGMVVGYGVTFYAYGSAGLAINAGTNATGTYTADYATSCSAGPTPGFGSNPGFASGYYVGEEVQFTAPVDASNGGVPGVVYMQNPSDNTASYITLANGAGMSGPGVAASNQCAGSPGDASTTSYMWGTIYAPNAVLTLDGIGPEPLTSGMCATVPRFTQVVAYTVYPINNINMGVNDCASPPTQISPVVSGQVVPDAIKDAVLVE